VRIDLHCHSSASDGTAAPAEVVSRARAAGVDVLALTDHDTVAGHPEAIMELPRGLTLVPGAELSCAVVDGGRPVSLHLLAYLFDPGNAELATELDALRSERVRRAAAMVERLVGLGAPVSLEQVLRIAAGGAIGRPHVAQALVEAGVVADLPAAFGADWIGSGGRAYVPKRALDPLRAISLVRAAGGVSVFAHPGASRRGPLVSDAVIAAMAGAGLAGLEVDHPDHDPSTRDRLRALAADLGLVVTGSSDDHGRPTGYRYGCETTAEAAYAELIGAAHGATPIAA